MKRRQFIKISSAAVLPIILGNCIGRNNPSKNIEYDISIHNDADVGHLLRKIPELKKIKEIQTDVLIVGAGLAGLSAAYQLSLNNREFLICELSDRIGGSSSSQEFMGQEFSQGAHYDLGYPENFGNEVLKVFEKLNIIEHNRIKNCWEFKEKKYLIPPESESYSILYNQTSSSVLQEGEDTKAFIDHLKQYSGKMLLPTRLIDKKYHHLDKIPFYKYLEQNIDLTKNLVTRINYQMRDDYGGKSNDVSALAGIHYYMCRPYYETDVELFSPQQGNSYFVNKIARNIEKNQILLNHLVANIEENKNNFSVTVLDIPNNGTVTVKAKKIIYAGQKHALKYTYPIQFNKFATNRYAPWLVMNIIVNSDLNNPAIWQNEIITPDKDFIGFVDSFAQYQDVPGNRILTAYFCLPELKRNQLLNIHKNKQELVDETLKIMSEYYHRPMEGIIEKIYIKVLGHAMPIPYPGYLFNDRNKNILHKNFVFAGVDNSRLPLLFEAIDSGLIAAGLI